MTLFDHKKVLKVIDEIVKQFAKTGKFKDTFYLWERGRTHRLQLIKRSEYKLSEVEFEAESRKFDIFENLIKNLAKMNRN